MSLCSLASLNNPTAVSVWAVLHRSSLLEHFRRGWMQLYYPEMHVNRISLSSWELCKQRDRAQALVSQLGIHPRLSENWYQQPCCMCRTCLNRRFRACWGSSLNHCQWCHHQIFHTEHRHAQMLHINDVYYECIMWVIVQRPEPLLSWKSCDLWWLHIALLYCTLHYCTLVHIAHSTCYWGERLVGSTVLSKFERNC